MSLNKNAVIRYQALDKCFGNPYRKYFIQDLIDTCAEALAEHYGQETSISRRQIMDDISFMRSAHGYDAPIESIRDGKKVFYRYSDTDFSINKRPINAQEAEQLREAILLLSRFKGLPQFEWIHELSLKLQDSFQLVDQPKPIISFDNNEYLKNLHFLSDLFQIIRQKQSIEICYRPFKYEHADIFIFSPYYLKQYNNRWFVLGKKQGQSLIVNLAIDRIQSFKVSTEIYEPSDIDFSTYFEDIIGVSKPKTGNPEKVILRIENSLWPYLQTKPLHGSQKSITKDDHYHTIQLEIFINYELISQLFALQDRIEVVAPASLRQTFKEKAAHLSEIYTAENNLNL